MYAAYRLSLSCFMPLSLIMSRVLEIGGNFKRHHYKPINSYSGQQFGQRNMYKYSVSVILVQRTGFHCVALQSSIFSTKQKQLAL